MGTKISSAQFRKKRKKKMGNTQKIKGMQVLIKVRIKNSLKMKNNVLVLFKISFLQDDIFFLMVEWGSHTDRH